MGSVLSQLPIGYFQPITGEGQMCSPPNPCAKHIRQETRMDRAKKFQVGTAVERELGPQAAASVMAALEIAWTEWTSDYEKKYGTWVSEWLLSDTEPQATNPLPELRYTGKLCSACHKPQFLTPSGITCGEHGGAKGIDPDVAALHDQGGRA